MKYLIVPEFLYMILFYGGFLAGVVSLVMLIRGIIRRCEKRYFWKWAVLLTAAVVVVTLTRTGVIVAKTMIGG